jgi:hypothetical protein
MNCPPGRIEENWPPTPPALNCPPAGGKIELTPEEFTVAFKVVFAVGAITTVCGAAITIFALVIENPRIAIKTPH